MKKCKYFDNRIYYLLPNDDIRKELNITFTKQLALLKNLQKAKMIELKFEVNKKNVCFNLLENKTPCQYYCYKK